MTITNALKWAIKKLEQRTDSAPLDAEILLSFCLNKPKEFLYTYPDYRLTEKEGRQFKKLIDCRKKLEPIAYLIGYKEFYGLKFLVNKHVLIPRPLSEQIIDKVQNIIKNRYTIHDTRYTICDIGTGSGCLIIALAKKLEEQKIINQFKLYAADVSKRALNVAQKNAKLHQVDKHITFLKGDLLKPLKNIRIDLIMANLPYLTKADIEKEISIKKEPIKALIGDFYPELFKQIKELKFKLIVVYEDKNGVNKKVG